MVGKTDIILDISNEEDIIQKIGDVGVRDLRAKSRGGSVLKLEMQEAAAISYGNEERGKVMKLEVHRRMPYMWALGHQRRVLTGGFHVSADTKWLEFTLWGH